MEYSSLNLGQRVLYDDTQSAGTVVAIETNEVKIKWDSGKTSYYRRDARGDVNLQPANEVATDRIRPWLRQ